MILSRLTSTFLFLLLGFPLISFALDNEPAEEEATFTEADLLEIQKYYTWVDSVETAMNWQNAGSTVTLGDGVATLTVPEGFKFLNPEQGKYILTDVYGNMEGENQGILFPANVEIFNDSAYFVIFSYDNSGYISDKEAQDLDYDELIATMKEDSKEYNKLLKENGYGAMELIGWASEPHYDQADHKLHWAKSLLPEGQEEYLLNYNLLALGRHGYLKMNFVADMYQLDSVQKAIPYLMPAVSFNDGYRYDQFDDSIDKVAAYGIGGLIAGKVLAKTGIFAALAKFGKFIILGIVAVFGGIFKRLKGN
ncbi:DUF2167 domain-containing protein [Persicobacter diffluens]|uniref:DUF2167 domain-containing protein n=1 Tax=Persicobacter diffluens TaxID=981 RepID=A0AAN4W2B1_9BACT|nr:hypothetical protein PEDI_39430 [Persicobacter diffluens]